MSQGQMGKDGTHELGTMDFAAGTTNNFKSGQNTHTKSINAEAGSVTNIGGRMMNLYEAPQLVNLKVLDLQSLQFVDKPFAYKPQNPNKLHVLDPKASGSFVSLPGYCEGAGCKLMNLNEIPYFLN